MEERGFIWQINEYSTLGREKGSWVESPIFHYARGRLLADWQLIFYPGGAGYMSNTDNSIDFGQPDNDKHVSVYLKLVRSNYTTVIAEFDIWFNDGQRLEGLEWSFGEDECREVGSFSTLRKQRTWGWRDAVPKDQIAAGVMMHEDQLFVNCDVYMVQIVGDPLDVFTSVDLARPDKYWSVYEKKKFTDIVVIARRKQFLAHKFVLAARSPVLMETFEQGSGRNCLEMTDFKADVVEQFLKFLYTGDCDLDVGPVDLLSCAERYAVPELKSECEVALVRQLEASNAFGYLNIAEIHRAELLKKSALEIIDHFGDAGRAGQARP